MSKFNWTSICIMVPSTAKAHSLTPAVFTKKSFVTCMCTGTAKWMPSMHQVCLIHEYVHEFFFFPSSIPPYPLLLGICSQVGGLWSYFWVAQPTFEMTSTFLLSFRAKNNPPWHNLWSIFGWFRRLIIDNEGLLRLSALGRSLKIGLPLWRVYISFKSADVLLVALFPWSYLAFLSVVAVQKANGVVQLKLA